MSNYTYEREEIHKGTGGATTTGAGEGLGEKITRKAGEAWESVKQALPGSTEHDATHPTSGTTGMGMGSGMREGQVMGDSAGAYGTTGTSYATTGHTGHHSGTSGGAYGTGEPMGDKISRKAGEAWESAKEAMPGTAEHKASHDTYGSGMGDAGMTGMHTAGHTGTHGGEPIGDKMLRKANEATPRMQEAWQDIKESTPGTSEHRAMHGTAGHGAGGYTGTTGTGAFTGMTGTGYSNLDKTNY